MWTNCMWREFCFYCNFLLNASIRSVMPRASLPECKYFPLNIDSHLFWGFLLHLGCTDGLCRLAYRLQCIHVASDLPLCVLQRFCMHMLKDHFMLSVPSPCCNWGLGFQVYGQTLLHGQCFQAERGIQKPHP